MRNIHPSIFSLSCKGRVTIFFRQRTGTVVVLQKKKKKKGLHSCDPRFLRDFQGDLKKKNVFTPATQLFLRIFEWSSQTNKKPGHFHHPAGTPGHGLKTGTVPAKPGRMVSLYKGKD